MKKEKLQVLRGSGNVFRDRRHENADGEQNVCPNSLQFACVIIRK